MGDADLLSGDVKEQYCLQCLTVTISEEIKLPTQTFPCGNQRPWTRCLSHRYHFSPIIITG
jgi:hypothetical protein